MARSPSVPPGSPVETSPPKVKKKRIKKPKTILCLQCRKEEACLLGSFQRLDEQSYFCSHSCAITYAVRDAKRYGMYCCDRCGTWDCDPDRLCAKCDRQEILDRQEAEYQATKGGQA